MATSAVDLGADWTIVLSLINLRRARSVQVIRSLQSQAGKARLHQESEPNQRCVAWRW